MVYRKYALIIGQLEMVYGYLQDQSMPVMAHAVNKIIDYLREIWDIQ